MTNVTTAGTIKKESAITCIFGGSFNPPHVAHVLCAVSVLATHEVARFIVVPTFQHPFAKTLVDYDTRLRMCNAALGWLPRVEVSSVERDLGGESRTLRTLEYFRRQHPEWSMRLVMGADLLAESPKWHAFDQIRELAPPLVLGRAGVNAQEAPRVLLPEISSTEIRDLVREEKWGDLAVLVPRDVVAIIRQEGLYQ